MGKREIQMAIKHEKMFNSILKIIQVKICIKYHFTLYRLVKLNRPTIPCIGKDVEQ